MRGAASSVVWIVVALALAVFVVVDARNPSSDERARRSAHVFPVWRRDVLARIELELPGERVVLERDATSGRWALTEPFREAADGATCDALASELELATIERRVRVADAEGLDAPRVRGSVAMGGLVQRFALGADTRDGSGGAYLRVEGGEPIVASRSLVSALTRRAERYRVRELVAGTLADYRRWTLDVPAGRFSMVRQADGRWTDGASAIFVDPALVERWASAVEDLRVADVPERAAVDAAIGVDATRLTLEGGDGVGVERVELRVGGPCPGDDSLVSVVVERPEARAVCVPRAARDKLALPSSEHLDVRPLALRPDEIAEIAFARGDERLDLGRRGAGWIERGASTRELSPEESDAASAIVRQLLALRARIVEHGAPPRAELVWGSVVARGPRGVDELLLLRPAAGTVRAHRARDGAALTFEEGAVPWLVPPRAALAPLRLFPSMGAVVGAFTRCAGVDQEVTFGASGPQLDKPVGYPIDAALALELADAIRRARSEGYVGAGPEAIDDRCVVGVRAADGVEHTIAFGGRAPGGVLARTDRGVVFAASDELRHWATRLLIDHAPLRRHPSEVAHVVVMSDARRVDLPAGRDGVDGGGDDVLAALASFRAERIVHLGPARPGEGLDRPSLTVEVRSRTDGGVGRVTLMRVGAAAGDLVHARFSGIDATYLVEARRLEAFRRAVAR